MNTKRSSLLTSTNQLLTDLEKKKLAETFLHALGTQNWDLLHSIITEDISWTLPGTSSISGEVKGANAIISRAQQIVSYGVSLELKHILYGQYNVTLSVHNQASRDGLILNEHLATVFTIYNGQIAKIETYLSDINGLNAFFIKQ
jgi:ketosteroid isomerase-like protein